jgi:hypothetical protein
MASADDYVGLRFGPFIIARQIGAGVEAEAFLVYNEMTQRPLVLRLDANDDRIWEAEPIIPPFNYSLECRNIKGSFVDSLNRTFLKIAVDSEVFTFKNVTIYGVLDLRYLIPLSDPFKVKNSISIRQLLSITHLENLYSSELWEMFALAMLSKAHLANQDKLHEEDWNHKWKYLAGGAILTAAVQNYLEGGGLTSREKSAIITRIASKEAIKHELAENLLIRLFECILRGFISLETAKATMRCEHFRTNLNLDEIAQFMVCCEILDQIIGKGPHLRVATEILKCLQFQPYSKHEGPEFFEYAFPDGPNENMQAFIENHSVDDFNLFLQEYATEQPFQTITVGTKS